MQKSRLSADDLYEYRYWGDLIDLAENDKYVTFKFKDRAVESNHDLAGVFLHERNTDNVYWVPNQSQMYKVLKKK
jgi:hypothetical protein